MRVLAIESSCDESAVAVLDEQQRTAGARAVEPGRPAPCLRRRGAGTGLARSRPAPAAAGARRAGRRGHPCRRSSRGRVYGRSRPGGRVAVRRGRWRARWPTAGGCRRSASITSRGTCWRRCSRPRRRSFPHLALLVSGGHTMLIEALRAGRLPPARRDTRRCRRRGLRQEREAAGSALSGRAAAGASWRPAGRRGACPLPRPMLDRAGLRVQLLGPEDRGVLAVRSQPARCAAARRHCARRAGCNRGHPVREDAARPGGDGPDGAGGGRRRRRQSRTARPAAARGRGARRAGVFPAPGILHRQRGNDCGGGIAAAAEPGSATRRH